MVYLAADLVVCPGTTQELGQSFSAILRPCILQKVVFWVSLVGECHVLSVSQYSESAVAADTGAQKLQQSDLRIFLAVCCSTGDFFQVGL